MRAIPDFKIKIIEYNILKTFFEFSEIAIRIQHQRQKAIPELVESYYGRIPQMALLKKHQF